MAAGRLGLLAFLSGSRIFFQLEKGSNWLPQALIHIGQQLLAIVIFVSRYFKSGASAAPSG
jgi:hypothetical protein